MSSLGISSMSEDPFGKWWPCLRKHYKRTHSWLPRAKALSQTINGRPFRYFTLCGRPMVDIYLLVKEKILEFDGVTRRIEGVTFCESAESVYPEVKELVGVEEAGFFGGLEDIVLFEDAQATHTLDTETAIEELLAKEGEGLDPDIRAKINEKLRHLQFRSLFPFDFLNLDFCDSYYYDPSEPPNVMRIHDTIDRLLEWQRRPAKNQAGQDFSIQKFVLAITCRVDLTTPADAIQRLKRILNNNRIEFAEYERALADRFTTDLDGWAISDPLDFFMSSWPKEIAKLARDKSWNIKIHDHAFYDRQNENGVPYTMVCLVVEFTQAPICQTYLPAVLNCLDVNSRLSIPRFEFDQGEGITLLADLKAIVDLRNEQAKHFERELLPDPLTEIQRLRSEGVPI